MSHMDAKLMRAASTWFEFDKAEAVVASYYFVLCYRFAAVFICNKGRRLFEITRKWNINDCMRLFWMADDESVIALMRFALSELFLELGFCAWVLGDDNYA